MRLFFGIDLAPRTKQAIDSWRQTAFHIPQPAIPAENLHLTLVFLGEQAHHRIEVLNELAQSIEVERFSLTFNETGFFAKPKIIWLGLSEPSTELDALATQLTKKLKRAGFALDNKPFTAHISLWRKIAPEYAQSKPIIPPSFQLDVEKLTLFESCQRPRRNGRKSKNASGVYYRAVEQWRLKTKIKAAKR